MLAFLCEDDFRCVAAIEQTDGPIDERRIHAHQVLPAPEEASFDVGYRDIVPAMAHALCDAKLRHFWCRQGEIDQLNAPVSGLQPTDQSHISAPGQRRLEAEVIARLDVALEHAAPEHVQRLGGKHLSKGEHAALRVAAIEGNSALKNTATIDRHIATHERLIQEGAHPGDHRTMIRDLTLARKVVQQPSVKFTRALEETRKLLLANRLSFQDDAVDRFADLWTKIGT